MSFDYEAAFIEKSIKVLIRAIFTLFMYYVFTMLAFSVTIICYFVLAIDSHGFLWLFNNPIFESEAPFNLFISLYNELWIYTPFADFLEGNISGISSYWNVLGTVFGVISGKEPQAAQQICENLFSDTAKVSMAALFTYLLSRLNKIIFPRDGIAKDPIGALFDKVVYIETRVLWTMSGFALGVTIVEMLERNCQIRSQAYLVMIIAPLLLHIILLYLEKGVDGKRSPLFLVMTLLTFDLAFNFINGYFLWMIAHVAARFGGFIGYFFAIVASILFVIALWLEDLVTKFLCGVSINLSKKALSLFSKLLRNAK